jgi:ankyrin repeat protein
MLLLKHGAKPDLPNRQGRAPLHFAALQVLTTDRI